MIQPKPEGNNRIRSYGILVGVRIEDGENTLEVAMETICGALQALPGMDDTIVEALGEIDDFDLATDMASDVAKDHGEQ